MVWFAGLVLGFPLWATPDHSVKVSERFFGSNLAGYAVLRVEEDNCASYYKGETSTWLDEYAAEDPSRSKAKSTLLLKVSHVIDPDDPMAKPVVNILEEQKTLTIADVLKRYPIRDLNSWTEKQTSKMQLDRQAGIRFRNRVFVIDGAVIDKQVFGGIHSQSEWRMDGVSDDGNLVYVQLSAGNDEGPQTRLIGVPLKVSKIIRDQLGMEPFYLVLDRFDTGEAAVSRARELAGVAREKKLFGFQPEVWSTRLPTDKMAWLVVAADSAGLIKSESVKKLEDSLGIDFEPVSSERFDEKIPLGD